MFNLLKLSAVAGFAICLAGTVSAADAPSSGCIGAEVTACMATMSRLLALTTESEHDAIKTDVNGKPFSDGYVVFCIHQSGAPATPCTMRITAYVRPNGKIWRLLADLQRSPFEARTEADYDETGLYDILTAIGLPKCSHIDRLDLYRWFENQVKPRTKHTHDFDASMSDIVETGAEQATAKFCGRTLFFYSFAGHAVSATTLDNQTGLVGGASVTIE